MAHNIYFDEEIYTGIWNLEIPPRQIYTSTCNPMDWKKCKIEKCVLIHFFCLLLLICSSTQNGDIHADNSVPILNCASVLVILWALLFTNMTISTSQYDFCEFNQVQVHDFCLWIFFLCIIFYLLFHAGIHMEETYTHFMMNCFIMKSYAIVYVLFSQLFAS